MINLVPGSIFDSECDLLIVPCNNAGGIAGKILKDLKAKSLPVLIKDISFGEVLFEKNLYVESGPSVVGFAASVDADGRYSNQKAIQAIAQDILSYSLKNNITSVNIPLLGTGAGRLNPIDSFASLRVGLDEELAKDIAFNVCVMAPRVFNNLQELNLASQNKEQVNKKGKQFKTKDEKIDSLLTYMKDEMESSGATPKTCIFDFENQGEDYLSFKEKSQLTDQDIEETLKICLSRGYIKHAYLSEEKYNITDEGHQRAISIEADFDIGEVGNDVNSRIHKFEMAFRNFLEAKKNMPSEAYGSGGHRFFNGDGRDVNLDRRKIKKDLRVLAVVDLFFPSHDNEELSVKNRAMQKLIETAEYSNMSAYIVVPAQKNTDYEFDIYEVADGDEPRYISCDDFPDYEKMVEAIGGGGEISVGEANKFKKLCEQLDDISRKIVEKGQELALNILPNNQIPTLSTSCLIFAMLELAISEDFDCGTLDYIFELITRDRIEYTRKAYIESLKENYSVAETENAKLDEPYVTTYVVEVLELAAKYSARTRPSVVIACRHLFAALITYKAEGRESGSLKRLRELGVSIEAVLKTFPEHLKQFDDDQEEWGRILDDIGDRQNTKTKPLIDGHLSAMSDSTESEDKLGRKKLASALGSLFKQSNKVEGFTVALMGDWGSGKTTAVKLLKDELKKQYAGEFLVATFNAWQYEHTDNIAAGMAQEVVGGLMEGANYRERFEIWLCFIWRMYKGDLWSIAKYLFVMLPIVVVSILIAKAVGVNVSWLDGVKGGGLLGLVVVVGYFIKNMKKLVDHPLKARLDIYMEIPRYGKYLGLIPVLKKHIKTLCELRLPFDLEGIRHFRCVARLSKRSGTRRLLVIVDDLDRCQSACITKVLDAVRLVMEIENVIVLICIDHRIAFRAIEEHYRELASDNSNDRNASDIARDYLGKIIHLPVRLLKPSEDELQTYISDKLFADAVEVEEETVGQGSSGGESMGSGDGQQQGTRLPEESGAAGLQESLHGEEGSVQATEPPKDKDGEMKETTEERDQFQELTKLFDFSNPRQLLRLRNSYRLLKKLDPNRAEKWERIMVVLFWLEFLNSQSSDVRRKCKDRIQDNDNKEEQEQNERLQKAMDIIDKLKASGNIVRIILETGKEKKFVEFVEVAVLPHNDATQRTRNKTKD